MKRQVGLMKFLSSKNKDNDVVVTSTSQVAIESTSTSIEESDLTLTSNDTNISLPPSACSQNVDEPANKEGEVGNSKERKKRKNDYVIGRAFKKEWLAEFPDIESVDIGGIEYVRCKVCTWYYGKQHELQCKYDNICKHHGKKKTMKVDENGVKYEVVEFALENKHQKNLKKYELYGMRMKQMEQKSTPLHLLFSEQDQKDYKIKSIQMKAVFFLLKSGRPMKQFPEIRELLLCAELSSCPVYHWSIPAGREFASFMNETLIGELRTIVQKSLFLSLSMDEVTAVDNTSWAAMHLYNVVDYERKSYFVGIFKLSTSSDAETLFNVIVQHLSTVVGMSPRDCANKLVCFGADGASVMQGNRTGLGVRIQTNLAPYLQVIHCMSHRTNLAYKVISDFPNVNKVEVLIKKAYKFFCKSPQRCAAFKSFAEGLTNGNKLLKDVATRWISLYAPVKRLCEEYASLIAVINEFTFSDDAATAASANELHVLLTDGETMFTLFAIEPLLHKLHYLISISQDGNIFIPEYNIARKQMQNQIENLYVDDLLTGQSCFEKGDEKSFSLWKKFAQIGSAYSFLSYNEMGVLCAHVREKHIELYIKKPRGRCNRPIKSDFKMEDLGYIVEKVKRDMAKVANALAAELRTRFPPDGVLDALGIVFPHSWNHVLSEEGISRLFRAKGKVIEEHFCCKRSFRDGQIEGLLDYDKLKEQAPLFGSTMYKQFGELEDPLDFGAVTRLWQKLGSNTLLRVAISEYFKLAELCLCMVLGSVQDERCFSTMNFVKNKLRNRLDGNLDATMRLYSCYHNIYDFPYEKAFQLWSDSCKRRGINKTVESTSKTIQELTGDAAEEGNGISTVYTFE